MVTYKPGMAYYGEFCTQRFDTGNAADADSLPVATATKNGSDDAAFALAVAKIDTGRYKITGTVPLTYTVNDVVQVSVAATVNGVAGKAVVDEFVVEEAAGASVVTITVEEADHTPIPDVSVMIFNSAQTVKLKSGMTDENGQLVVALNDGSYKIMLSKSMANFTTPETLTVSGATAKTCTGALVSPTAPSAGLQTVMIYPADLDFVYNSNVKITAIISDYNQHIDTAIITSQVLTAIDKGTHFEMQIAKGVTVEVTAKLGSTKFGKKEITITNDNTRYLSQYL